MTIPSSAIEACLDNYQSAIKWVPLDQPVRDDLYRELDCARLELAALRASAVSVDGAPSPSVAEMVAELDEIEERATKGPWWVSTDADSTLHDTGRGLCRTDEGYKRVLFTLNPNWPTYGADAALIVALRNAWPDLRRALTGGT